ncbi:MAG TPA: type IV pilin biogenesis protein, partial [Nannocystaceae bacterium]|nr:type IV pilin biogenesis protein [Nannocystaceae bacterium]
MASLLAICGLVGLIAVMLAAPARARVQPYYVVKGLGVGDVRPRILFVLDTSGSMGFQAQAADIECPWNDCENTASTTQSRITAARGAIKTLVETMSDSASFSLMTFEQNGPQTGSVPAKCSDGQRFRWVTYYGYFVWNLLSHNTGFEGSWLLCDNTNRPYPYLRWDELGAGSKISADDLSDAVPASPLVSTAQSDMTSTQNAARRVQWFPKFMGVRANLNSTTDPDGTILAGTIGDWASNDAERTANVLGHDFYYWPYVDGFPGYSVYVSYPPDPAYDYVGVAQEDAAVEQASLYAPFYLDLASSSVPAADRGPASEEAAKTSVLAAVAPLVEGGVDAVGGSPWKSVIGEIPASAPNTNAVYGHTSVASYLKFLAEVDATDACAPTSVVIVTDGRATAGEGGAELYTRLAALRETLNVKTYVVGFLADDAVLDDMACAAAGACDGSCSTPCDDTPTDAWDTCADKTDPTTGCSFSADSPAALASVLSTIVADAVAAELDAGPGTTVREFGVGADGVAGAGDIVQTTIRGTTDWPGWRGHVVRTPCDEEDPANPGQLAPWCDDPGFTVDETEPTFGPCPQSRSWDAGECLRQTAWQDRRLFTHDASNQPIAIADADGKATAQFVAELVASGAMTNADAAAHGDEFAAFLLGKDWPSAWKLPGLADSAPVVVRRIPRYQPQFSPSVSIRDPHCAGRQLSDTSSGGLPDSLENFAREAWADANRIATPEPHLEYQEAVMVGDDLGVLHAFQLDSGNELWGLLPRFLLANAVKEWQNGAAVSGQPSGIDNHLYGIAATLNQGWVFDDQAASPTWRHLGIVGLGAGGSEFIALDLSHMSPESPDGPFEILWTTEDAAVKASYDAYAGETWARPALTYDLANDSLTVEPQARLVMTSGYRPSAAASTAGRTI